MRFTHSVIFGLQNIEKDCQIASLQRQLDCKTLVTSPLRENNNRLGLIDRFEPAKKNGATQTERVSLNFHTKNVLQTFNFPMQKKIEIFSPFWILIFLPFFFFNFFLDTFSIFFLI